MSSNNTSGVRNLRAMFENKASSEQSTSPPSRGRSPLHAEDTENTRPLSKVRASFVAVEKPGQPGQPPLLGLRKASDVSSISGNTADESSLKRITSRNSKMATNGQTAQINLGMILKGSPFEDDNPEIEKQTEALHQALTSAPAEQTPKIDTTDSAANPASVAPPTVSLRSPASNTKPKSATLNTSKSALPVKGLSAKTTAPKSSEKSPISPQSPPSAKVATTQLAPSIKGIRGGPSKIKAVLESANRAQVERLKNPSITETKSDQPEKKAATPTTTNVKTEASTSTEKASKPTVQSTKPPVVAKAPTGPGAARTDGPPKSLNTDNRRVSAVRREKPPPKVASTSTASSLAKRTPRNSLAPQSNGHERPRSRVSTAKDESFLARMTRPTASSQQKVTEKVTKAESPPRARKVSDKVRQSLGGVRKDEDKENAGETLLEAAKSAPEVEEPKEDISAETAVAQEAT